MICSGLNALGSHRAYSWVRKLTVQFTAQLQGLFQQAKQSNHRQLVVLSGDYGWCINQLVTCVPLLTKQNFSHAIWLGDEPATSLSDVPFDVVKQAKANTWLGSSTDFIVADLFSGFHPDALAGISGTLKGGGVLVLMVPPFEQWTSYPDPDYQRMLVYPQTEMTEGNCIEGRFVSWISQTLREDPNTLIVTENNDFSEPSESVMQQRVQTSLSLTDQQSDQSKLVSVLLESVNSSTKVMVVRGDRGRGKSAALGMVAAKLLRSCKNKPLRVCVTAPRPGAVKTLFQFARSILGESESTTKFNICCEQSQLFFAAPDEIIRNTPRADLLIVDEAAAIPIFMLETLLDKFPKVIFASTVHGYEGTGRGFDLRFAKVLDKQSPGWKQWTLTHPIRWADNDPVERWINNAFLLDAEAPRLTFSSISNVQIYPISQDELRQDTDLLKQVYALLIQAHYRTTPGDLRDLLDGNLSLWVQMAELQNTDQSTSELIVGVLLLAKEGELPSDLSQEIWAGRRRPRGHLIPQYLAAQAGFMDAAQLSFLRVVRIAVHPDLQSEGLGSLLLTELNTIAKQEGVQAVGAMFAASDNLMHFWRSNGFSALRLGVSRDSSSGSYTALVSKVIDSQYSSFFHEVEMDFLHQLQQQLATVWKDLEPELLMEMIKSTTPLPMSEKALKDVESFVLAHRGFDQVRSVMAVYVFQLLQRLPNSQYSTDWAMLVRYLLQGEDVSHVIKRWQVTGIKDLHTRVKQFLLDNQANKRNGVDGNLPSFNSVDMG